VTTSAQEDKRTAHEARRREITQRRIFYRWVWLVYAPLPLGFLATMVVLSGILPGFLTLPYLVLLAWDVLSIRLIVERRRRKVSLHVPRTLPIGLGVTAGAVLIGLVLIWMGVDRLSSQAGPALMVLGGFLILTAMFAPVMKIVDLALRLAGRGLLRIPAHTQRSPASPRRKPANPEPGPRQAA
jgi:hypothetical protein